MVIHLGINPISGGRPPNDNIIIRTFIINTGFCLINIEIERELRFIICRYKNRGVEIIIYVVR